MKILLASQSPRRRELLSTLGFEFEVVSTDVEEVFPESLPASEVAAYLSHLKADSFSINDSETVLITADTVVVLGGKIFGKPVSETDAVHMLCELSGKRHEVYTAFTIKTLEKSETFTDVAEVQFDTISEEEAEFYVKNFRPLDKAGAYGIQDWIGLAKINRIVGSFYTIMGLPTHLLYRELKKRGF